MEITFKVAQERTRNVLLALDQLSTSGEMKLFGVNAIQQMAGIIGVLTEIVNSKEMIQVQETEKDN